MGSGANPPGGAGRSIEHPGRNLQPSIRCRTREAAAEYRSASLRDHLIDVDVVPRPWVPGIKNLAHLGSVGVLASSSTMGFARMLRLVIGPRHRRCSCRASPRGWLRNPSQFRRPRSRWRRDRP